MTSCEVLRVLIYVSTGLLDLYSCVNYSILYIFVTNINVCIILP